MKVIKNITQVVAVTDDVLCNRCGKSTIDEIKLNREYATLSVTWGYGSHRDGERHVAHLCETCFDEITACFKLPTLESEHNYV